jgi:hypothetical protein
MNLFLQNVESMKHSIAMFCKLHGSAFVLKDRTEARTGGFFTLKVMSSHTELSVKRIVAKEKQKTNFGAFTVVN